jgi:hypothetical protein
MASGLAVIFRGKAMAKKDSKPKSKSKEPRKAVGNSLSPQNLAIACPGRSLAGECFYRGKAANLSAYGGDRV